MAHARLHLTVDAQRLEVQADAAAAAARAAELIAAQLREGLAARGRATLAVSGGRTPERMLELLARTELPWDRVDVFQVDERVAPAGDPDRNALQLRRAFAAQPERLHFMPVEGADLAAGAIDYARTLAAAAGHPPTLDVVHLGLGADGHVASLFPGSALLEETRAAVAVTPEAHAGRRRMTLTLPVLGRARLVLLLVTGADKRSALARLTANDSGLVASRVRPAHAVIVADLEAAPSIP
ncbi:MAG TPA: 6-phosphogluconolactonase [Gammaproteobacteria bacterium]|nr:6-phosphogluconolactonase [Gammaproteobacteria bacterium]